MAGSVAHLPSTPSGGDGGITPADIYRIAVEEYRFQADYNWKRTQYLLGLNVAILAAAVALTSRPGHGAVLVFVVGAVAAVLSASVVRTQHSYYRAARNHMQRVEEMFELPLEQRLNTTSTLGHRGRLLSVNQIVYFLLLTAAASDSTGIVLVLTR